MNGYYYGKKKAEIPALLQFVEQLARVGSVMFLCYLYKKSNYTIPLALTAAGSAIAELVSMLLSITLILPYFSKRQTKYFI